MTRTEIVIIVIGTGEFALAIVSGYVPCGRVLVVGVFPAVSVKLPGEHCVAAVAPKPATNEPAGAGVHAAAPVPLKNPAAQGVTEIAPGPVANEPAGAG